MFGRKTRYRYIDAADVDTRDRIRIGDVTYLVGATGTGEDYVWIFMQSTEWDEDVITMKVRKGTAICVVL